MANAEELESGLRDGSARLTDLISLGVLAEVIGRDLIEDVLDETGRRE
jgi:hypothetical protein